MKYAYPAIFTKGEEGEIEVDFPDVKGCFTYGDDMPDAMEMAKDCLEMMLVHYEDEKLPIPPASDIKSIKTDGIVSLILVLFQAVIGTVTLDSLLGSVVSGAILVTIEFLVWIIFNRMIDRFSH